MLLSFFNGPHKTIVLKVARLLNTGDEMLRPQCMIAVCAFALSIGAANADSIVQFDVMGTSSDGSFTGTIEIDETTNTATNVNIDFPARSFFDVFVDITLPDLTMKNIDGDMLTLNIPANIGIADVPITGSIVNGPSHTDVIYGITGDLVPTPLPAALPLFASGLGALGLLGWRRKRKSAALAA